MLWVAAAVLAAVSVQGHDSASAPGSGAQFLQSVISQLKIDNGAQRVVELGLERASQITGPTPLPFHEHQHNLEHNYNYNHEQSSEHEHSHNHISGHDAIPPPPLSKEELAALYEAALQKGATLDLSAGGAIHGGLTPEQQQQLGLSGHEAQGYYYYFYPLKNVKQEQQKQQQETNQVGGGDMMMMMDEGGEKRVEPLFMAVSGFIGMALMFVVTVLFLPKFGTMRSRGITALKHAPHELGALTKLVVDAIDGHDCNARIACEVGRAVRTMRLDKKPLRIIERMLPVQLSKQVQKIRQAAAKKEQCEIINCKLEKTKKVSSPHLQNQSQKKVSNNVRS